jgi:hypothetical protein
MNAVMDQPANVSTEVLSKLINIAGRQRMLSQRICVCAMMARTGSADSVEQGLALVDFFLGNHENLSVGGGGYPGLFSRDLHDAFFGLENNDALIRKFAEQAADFFMRRKNGLRVTDEQYDFVVQTAFGRLLNVLDAITGVYEREMKKKGEELSRTISKHNTELKDLLKDVSSLARRTRLVSFNAHVLSVRAGEAGRDFKVIANEIDQMSVTVSELANRALEKVTTTGAV